MNIISKVKQFFYYFSQSHNIPLPLGDKPIPHSPQTAIFNSFIQSFGIGECLCCYILIFHFQALSINLPSWKMRVKFSFTILTSPHIYPISNPSNKVILFSTVFMFTSGNRYLQMSQRVMLIMLTLSAGSLYFQLSIELQSLRVSPFSTYSETDALVSSS